MLKILIERVNDLIHLKKKYVKIFGMNLEGLTEEEWNQKIAKLCPHCKHHGELNSYFFQNSIKYN